MCLYTLPAGCSRGSQSVDSGIKFARLLPSQSEAVWGRDVAAAESLWKFPSLRLWDLYENHFLKSSIFIVEIEG